MPDDSHLPGYSVDDDAPDDPPTTEPAERQGEPVSVVTVSADVGDAVSSAATDTSPSEPVSVSTQPTPTPPSQQGEGQEDLAITTTPSLPERPDVDEFADPKISSLHAIFPDFDAALLYSVVDSVGGDQDRAVDALLAMSDPDHVPVDHAPAREQPSVAEQTQLDEEFARRLLLEDEQQFAREQVTLQQQQQEIRQFPYAQRANAPQQGGRGNGAFPRDDVVTAQQPPPQQQQRDTMTDVQEHISKLAETGKRTFSSFVSKVKAKVQEFDQNRNTQTPSFPGASTATGYAVGQPSSPVPDRHAQQAYYAPRAVHNARQGSISDESQNPPQPSAPSASDSLRDSADADVPPPPQTHSGRPTSSNIDPGKIGLLPKRSVSLVTTESQPGRAHNEEEEEELEYVENPFEEGRYT